MMEADNEPSGEEKETKQGAYTLWELFYLQYRNGPEIK